MKRWSRARRALRAVLLVTAFAVVLALVMVSRARAEAEDELWRLGSQLTSMSEHIDPTGDPRTLVVNGAEIVIRSQHVDAGVGGALDAAEEACGGFEVGERSTTLRAENADHGFVACFVGLGELDARGLLSAGAAFLADGDLSALGAFDYTYVRASVSGVHQLRARIPRLDLDAMFPATGDAPGLDVAGVPRPPEARRLLSAFDVDQPYQIAIYHSDRGTPGELGAGYRAQLEADGWGVQVGHADRARVTLVAFRASAMVAIVVRGSEGGLTTTVAAGL